MGGGHGVQLLGSGAQGTECVGVWLGSPGQAKIEHKESGRRTVGAGPSFLFHLSHTLAHWPCVITLNLDADRNMAPKTGLQGPVCNI